tara:strand:+ start:9982 stop:10197 length:216 start_codon:yes stop_codon:yes gene_type:complete
MGRIEELKLMVEEEFSPPDRESAEKIAQQLLENPALYLKKFRKHGTKDEAERSDTSVAGGQDCDLKHEQPI